MKNATTHIKLDAGCGVSLHRTLRIPNNGESHPLPPSLGRMSAYKAGKDDYVVPMWPAEAVWLSFDAPHFKPHALKVGIGATDAISGKRFDPTKLSAKKQDYLVIPDQPWLDGINAGDGFVRQFVAAPLGEGLTVESQLNGGEERGGMTLSLFAPKKGHFPDAAPPQIVVADACLCESPLGIGAGGRMRQEIFADEYGISTWKKKPVRTVSIELVDASAFQALTGIAVAPPVVDAASYSSHGLPWFDFSDPARRDIAAAKRLSRIRSVDDLRGARRRGESFGISESQIVRLLRVRGA